MKKLFLFGAFFFTQIFSLFSQETASSFNPTLRRNIQAEPDTFDPHKIWGIHGVFVLRDVLEGLFTLSPDNKPIPAVAETWAISPDAKEYTFYLRKTARWSNGDPVTAHDFVFTWQRCVNPKTAAQKASFLSPIINADAIIKGEKKPEELGVKALDDYTLRVNINLPDPNFLTLLGNYIFLPIHKASVLKHGDAFSRPGNFVCNGAFSLAEWQPQDFIRITKNKDYWDKTNVKLNEVIYYPIENQAVVLKRYQSGSLDLTYDIPESQMPFIKARFKDELKVGPYLTTAAYGVNLLNPPFKNNHALRQALYLAVDRDTLVKKVTASGETPAYTWIHPFIKDVQTFVPGAEKMSTAEREKMAIELYHEAGYSKENPLHFELRYDTNERHRKVAIAVSSMWNRVLGVRCHMMNEELKVFLQNRRMKQITQMFRNFVANETGSPFFFTEVFLSNSPLNTTGYRNPQFDALVKKAQKLTDQQERFAVFSEAHTLLLDDLPAIPLYHAVNKRLVKPYVKGYQNSFLDYIYSKTLSIDEKAYHTYKESLNQSSH